jgi:hypothetical protein
MQTPVKMTWYRPALKTPDLWQQKTLLPGLGKKRQMDRKKTGILGAHRGKLLAAQSDT